MKVFFAVFTVILTLSVVAIGQTSSPVCEPTTETQKLLDQVRVPADARFSNAEVRDKRLAMIRTALQASPRDIFLHLKYQDLDFGTFGIGRKDAIKEFEALLKQHPDDPLFLYLAARAHFTSNTKQSIDYLQRSIKNDPQFAWPHLLLAEIYESRSFDNPAGMRSNLADFQKLCPDSPAMFSSLRWNNDKELIAQTAQHLRQTVANRTDTSAVLAYVTIWNLGLADERPEKQVARVEQVKQDVTRLRMKEYPRTMDWLRAMQSAAEEPNDRKIFRSAMEEIAALFPDSSLPTTLEISKWEEANPLPPSTASDEIKSTYRKMHFEKMRELSSRWPNVFNVSFAWWDAALAYENASPEDIGAAFDRVAAAMEKFPDNLRTSPPYQTTIAEDLLKHNARINDIPSLVAKGLLEGDKLVGEQMESDLYPSSRQAKESERTYWHLYGYFPLAEAYLRMNQLDKAQETLISAEESLSIVRPSDKASAEDKARFSEMEARFWQEKGELAEKQGHKLDALISFRNALVLFPPRRVRPDTRDQVMADAKRIWKEMGGTDQGWADWSSHSSLNNFNAGAAGPNAWKLIAQTKPGLVLTDSQGKEWKPNELKDKTVFVNYWATWCGPCRVELPYLQKLYERFKDRPDVVILSLNVDDDPKAMMPMLKQIGVTMPSIAARDFGYQLLPVMALPSNWIVSAKGNVMFLTEESMDKWVEAAVAALEKAAKK